MILIRPLGFKTEEKLLLHPYSCYIKCFKPPDLFAGKIHALLFRKWKNRVKGRDWFDFEWYVKQGIPVNLPHLSIRASQCGNWENQRAINKDDLIALLTDKIESVSFNQVKQDVVRFIPDQDMLKIWSAQYFLDLLKYLKIEDVNAG